MVTLLEKHEEICSERYEKLDITISELRNDVKTLLGVMNMWAGVAKLLTISGVLLSVGVALMHLIK